MTNDQTKRMLLRVIDERNTRARKALYELATKGLNTIFELTRIQPMQDNNGLVFPMDLRISRDSPYYRRGHG